MTDRIPIRDERGVIPNYVIEHNKLIHQPTEKRVQIAWPMDHATLRDAFKRLRRIL